MCQPRRFEMRFVSSVTLDQSFESACEKVVAAFGEQGFGVLTTVDVQGVLKEKLQQVMEPYRIYGICNPKLASQALAVEPQVGVMLPCTVVVRQSAGGSEVVVLRPTVIAELDPDGRLRPIMEEANERVDAAVSSLAETDFPEPR
jgi:uncharacterized protein (DUF302 family)